jgi:hypothetical protein
MAKRRKGAKRGSSASRSKSSKAVPPKQKRKPVAPVPRKRAKVSKKGSSAARRGWETRRRENPLKWGREAVAKRREKLQSINVTASAIEKEWRSLERKAVRQKREAERAGGVHPTIAGKLSVLEKIESEIADMKANIRRFNSPSPDVWELRAYTLLEKFITLRDFGGSSQEIKEVYRQWYMAKQEAREKSPDWPAWMAMIGSVLGLPMHGKFSIDSFVTS